MHPYSTQLWERERVFIGLAILSIGLSWSLYQILIVSSIEPPWWVGPPSVVSIYGFTLWVFDHFLWSHPWLGRLKVVGIPSFTGRWVGELSSSFDDYGSKIGLVIVIRQTWLRISIVLSTDSSSSKSQVASLSLDDATDPALSYQYLNDPQGDSVAGLNIHRGTAVVVLEGENLVGDYYTGRGRGNHGAFTARKTQA